MVKIVIFDFDGVLVDSVDIKTGAFAKLFQGKSPEIVEAVVAHHLAHGSMSRFDKISYYYKEFLKQPLTDDMLNSLCSRFAEIVVEEVIRAPYVKGAKGFLDNYSRLYECYVVSGTPEGELKEIIKRRNMNNCFRGVYGAPRKKVEIIKEILDTTDCNPQEVVFIGDDLPDYEAVTMNGVKFIGVVGDENNLLSSLDITKIPDLSSLGEVLGAI